MSSAVRLMCAQDPLLLGSQWHGVGMYGLLALPVVPVEVAAGVQQRMLTCAAEVVSAHPTRLDWVQAVLTFVMNAVRPSEMGLEEDWLRLLTCLPSGLVLLYGPCMRLCEVRLHGPDDQDWMFWLRVLKLRLTGYLHVVSTLVRYQGLPEVLYRLLEAELRVFDAVQSAPEDCSRVLQGLEAMEHAGVKAMVRDMKLLHDKDEWPPLVSRVLAETVLGSEDDVRSIRTLLARGHLLDLASSVPEQCCAVLSDTQLVRVLTFANGTHGCGEETVYVQEARQVVLALFEHMDTRRQAFVRVVVARARATMSGSWLGRFTEASTPSDEGVGMSNHVSTTTVGTPVCKATRLQADVDDLPPLVSSCGMNARQADRHPTRIAEDVD